MVFSFGKEDLLLSILGALTTAFIISWMQRRPVKPIGIIDFILGEHEPRVKVYAKLLVFIVPIIVGMLLGFFDLSSYFIGGLATAVGALLSVSTAFFHPKMLAPPLQKKIGKARLVYTFFIVTYGLLGIVGAFITSQVPTLLQSKSFHFNIFVNVVSQIAFVFCAIAFNFLIQSRFKKEFPKTPLQISANGLDKRLLKMITIEVHKAVSEATATAVKVVKNHSTEDLKKIISDELSQQIREIPHMIDLAYHQIQVRSQYRGYDEIAYNEVTLPQSYEFINLYSYIDDYSEYLPVFDNTYLDGSYSYATYDAFDYLEDYLGGYDWGYGYGDNSRYFKWHYPGYFS